LLEPVSVALKFGFLAVLYLFLFWVSRSALKDLRRPGVETVQQAQQAQPQPAAPPPDATGLHSATRGLVSPEGGGIPLLRVERAVGLESGAAFELVHEVVLGRSAGADIQLEDTFASSRHARIARQGSVMVLEDLGSTNGTFLNGEPLRGPQPLHHGDRIRIGETEFSYEP
jgi:pSer/pThr/pTyr-binding forkhead associated (FHA) protein